jgi:cell division protein FtsB
MVVRRGIRSLLLALLLYLVSGGVVWYFLLHAQTGSRGLEALGGLQTAIRSMETELAALTEERQGWEKRLRLMRDEGVDRDLLDERARSILGRVHRNDVVVIGR